MRRATTTPDSGKRPAPPRPPDQTRVDVERLALTIAAGQHGVVTRRQLLAAGASARRIEGRVTRRVLRPLHRGVYLVGPIQPPLAVPLAACLACGPDAIVSHRSAARLWAMLGPGRPGEPVDVTITGAGGRRSGVRVHRSRTLRRAERTRIDGVPLTTPPRTLLDLAGVAPLRDVEKALAEAFAKRLATETHVRGCLERHPRQPGAARLRAILEGGAPLRTRSEAEERLLRLLRTAGTPMPRANARVGPYEVDFYWPGAGLVVEVDGFASHGSRRAFERDRRRDAHLAGRGLRVVRVTWRQMDEEPEALLFRLGQALGTGG